MRTFTAKQNQAHKTTDLTKSTLPKPGRKLESDHGLPFIAAATRDFTVPGGGHDFSRVPVFFKKLAGSGNPAGEASPLSSSDGVGIGKVDSVPEASERAELEEKISNVTPDAAVSAPADACTIKSRTIDHAPDGTPDTRWVVGVCETIEFNLGLIRVADWSANSGYFNLHGSKPQQAVKWTAPEEPGLCMITAEAHSPKQKCIAFVYVVAPAKITMTNPTIPKGGYPSGTAGALMHVDATLHPLNVSFHSVEWKEDPNSPPEIEPGYFANKYNPKDLYHTLANENFQQLDEDNRGGDTAGIKPETPLPGPWEAGSFCWTIPNRYRCADSSGQGFFFTNTRQCFIIDDTGTVTVTKEGASLKRSPNE